MATVAEALKSLAKRIVFKLSRVPYEFDEAEFKKWSTDTSNNNNNPALAVLLVDKEQKVIEYNELVDYLQTYIDSDEAKEPDNETVKSAFETFIQNVWEKEEERKEERKREEKRRLENEKRQRDDGEKEMIDGLELIETRRKIEKTNKRLEEIDKTIIETSNANTTSKDPTYSIIKNDGSQDQEDWFDEYEAIAKAWRWNETRKCEEIRLQLTKEALMKYKAMPSEYLNNFKKIRWYIIDKFKPPNQELLAMIEYTKMSRKTGESLETYATRFKKTIKKSEALMNLSERSQLEAFVRGMSSEIRTYVMSQRPTSIETVVMLCDEHARIAGTDKYAISSIVDSGVEVEQPVDKYAEMCEMMNKMMTKLNWDDNTQNTKTMAAVNFEPKVRKQPTCYKCQGKGHMSRTCTFDTSIRCRICKNRGHSVDNCTMAKNNLNL
jgi:hypothetical protein